MITIRRSAYKKQVEATPRPRRVGAARRQLQALVALLVVGSAAVYATSASTASTSARSATPIKIGYIYDETGFDGALGIGTEEGAKFYYTQHPTFRGHPVDFIPVDDASDPNVGLQAARKLVLQDGVQIVEGIQCSCVAPAVVPYLVARHIPTIIDNAGTTALTQGQRSKWVFRTAYTNPQQNLPMGKYINHTLHDHRLIIVTLDYSAGFENAQVMAKVFKAAGGKVVTTIYVPEDATDMAPYVTKLLSYVGKADVVDGILFGAPAVGFVNDSKQLGLSSKMRMVCLGCTIDGLYLPQEGANAIGFHAYGNYFTGIGLPANKAFMSAYKKATGHPANLSTEAGYVGAEAVGAGLAAVGGNLGPQGSSQTAFLSAERRVHFPSPQGPFRYDNYQNAIITVWIARPEKVGGQYKNVIIDSVPNVGQYYPAATP